MKISVIIPIYNGLQYIRECLKSIKNQTTLVEIEIILIDDASTDNLEFEIFSIKDELSLNNLIYIRNAKQLGPAKARNIGIELASGNYIAFLDADDWWEKTKLEEQLKLIEKGYKFIYTGRKNVDGNKEKIVSCSEKVSMKDILKNNQITCSSVLLDSNIAKNNLMAYSDLCEDYYTWLKILKNDLPFAYGINKPLVNYRIHSDSQSSNKIKHAMKRYKIYKVIGIPFYLRIYYISYYMVTGLFKYYIGKREKKNVKNS